MVIARGAASGAVMVLYETVIIRPNASRHSEILDIGAAWG
jgi:hypothetical protein